jgi:hypothetical protein
MRRFNPTLYLRIQIAYLSLAKMPQFRSSWLHLCWIQTSACVCWLIATIACGYWGLHCSMSSCARSGPIRTGLTIVTIICGVRLRSCGTQWKSIRIVSIAFPLLPCLLSLSFPKPSRPLSHSQREPRCHIRAGAGPLTPSKCRSSPTEDNRVRLDEDRDLYPLGSCWWPRTVERYGIQVLGGRD